MAAGGGILKAYRVRLEVRAQVEVDVVAKDSQDAMELAKEGWQLGDVVETYDVEVDSVERMEFVHE